MPPKKFKIQVEDPDGSKCTITMDGNVTREKMLQLLNVIETNDEVKEQNLNPPTSDSLFGRLYQIIETKFPLGSFTSSDILETYEDEFNETLRLSTISTYLSRMSLRNLLSRSKTGSTWNYKLIKNIIQC